MKLFYKGEFLKRITKEESEKIYGYKGIQVMVDGELLKKSQIEIKKDDQEDQNRMMSDYTKEELYKIVGNFREEYRKALNGEVIHNAILGYVKEGIVKYALEFGAINSRKINGEDIYYVSMPKYNFYQEKLNAMSELNRRKEYAISKVGGGDE